MAIASTHPVVGTTAVIIAENTSPERGASGDFSTKSYCLRNVTGSETVFLGDSTVTTTTGFRLLITDPALSITLEPGEVLYGRVATTSQTLEVLESGR